MSEKSQCSSFTTCYPGLCLQLRSEVKIFDGDKMLTGPALWDTGASCSCISHDVANKLQLQPIGKRAIQTPTGRETVNRYLVNIHLPNDVTINSVEVCESEIGAQNLSLLIGMDIIIFGDFAVSNHNKQTMFTFRIPSQKQINFVMESRIGTHGQGKRKRKKK